MRRLAIFVLLTFCVLLLCSCAGDISQVKIRSCSSELYSEAEIADAVETTKKYFHRNFRGCKLTEIGYLGDEKLDDYQEFAERNHADHVIVLVSSFDVDASGGDGSLNPNSSYRNWKWILVRKDGGSWQHVDHGY